MVSDPVRGQFFSLIIPQVREPALQERQESGSGDGGLGDLLNGLIPESSSNAETINTKRQDSGSGDGLLGDLLNDLIPGSSSNAEANNKRQESGSGSGLLGDLLNGVDSLLPGGTEGGN